MAVSFSPLPCLGRPKGHRLPQVSMPDADHYSNRILQGKYFAFLAPLEALDTCFSNHLNLTPLVAVENRVHYFLKRIFKTQDKESHNRLSKVLYEVPCLACSLQILLLAHLVNVSMSWFSCFEIPWAFWKLRTSRRKENRDLDGRIEMQGERKSEKKRQKKRKKKRKEESWRMFMILIQKGEKANAAQRKEKGPTKTIGQSPQSGNATRERPEAERQTGRVLCTGWRVK